MNPLDRTPPSEVKTEERMAGCLLLADPSQRAPMLDFLRHSDFHDPLCEWVYDCCGDRKARNLQGRPLVEFMLSRRESCEVPVQAYELARLFTPVPGYHVQFRKWRLYARRLRFLSEARNGIPSAVTACYEAWDSFDGVLLEPV